MWSIKKRHKEFREAKKKLAERGFDPRTSGLWAQHASTAPLCSDEKKYLKYKRLSAFIVKQFQTCIQSTNVIKTVNFSSFNNLNNFRANYLFWALGLNGELPLGR